MTAFGFLVIDKPLRLTSHDVVARTRRGTGIKRIGHAGTLDPLATGVLVLCIGAATRLSEFVMGSDKEYVATVRIGTETNTYDGEGHITRVWQIDHLDNARLLTALGGFQGDQMQIPPMHSAIKRGRDKLYELAREGKQIELAPRPVWMQIEVLHADLPASPDVTLRIICSAGTYIRSLAHDLGRALGVGAYLIGLRRVRSGPLNDPVDWQVLSDAFAEGTWSRYLIDVRGVLPHWPELTLDAEQTQTLLNGGPVDVQAHVPSAPAVVEAGTRARAYGPEAEFLAVCIRRGDLWWPEKVFVSPQPGTSTESTDSLESFDVE